MSNCRDVTPQVVAVLALLLIVVIFYPGLAKAQSLEPRAYSNLPVGMNFLIRQTLRQHRRADPHRGELRPVGDRLAMPLGGRALNGVRKDCRPAARLEQSFQVSDKSASGSH